LLLAEQAGEDLVVLEDLAHSQEQPTLVVAVVVAVVLRMVELVALELLLFAIRKHRWTNGTLGRIR
jgi:hypothetical protein